MEVRFSMSRLFGSAGAKHPRFTAVCHALVPLILMGSPGGLLADDAPREEIIVTSSKVEEPSFLTPYAVNVIDADRIRVASFRTTPDIFREVPGAMVQKTAHGQGSPYLRGFTGYRTLFMIDSIRLNNSVFRDGPNQYWSTVDLGTFERVEVVLGPSSVLYGSDAIGGTVNALTRNPKAYLAGASGGDLAYRGASAEHSNSGRATADLALSPSDGLLIGASKRDYGDLESGDGRLPNTGYNEWAMDAKWLRELSDSLRLTTAHFQVHQDNVPRTHSTVASVPYAGTEVGSDLQRNLNQDRTLTYARLEAAELLGLQSWDFSLYHTLQKEEEKRERSGNRHSEADFKVNTYGFNATSNMETGDWGRFTFGADWARDFVDSQSSSNPIQGPVADDSTYDWAGIFVQNRYQISTTVDLTSGIRLAFFDANAGSISDPVTGSEFSYQQDWLEPVGSLRLGWMPIADSLRLYSGISQGFRAPNLSDLTRYDIARSNEFEVPSVNLDPEHYTTYDIGAKLATADLSINGAVYYTDISNQIQRLTTGRVNEDGDQEVTKSNVGDGEVYGVELQATWQPVEQWLVFGHYAWLDGQITSEATVGAPAFDDNPSRLMPANYRLGLQYQPGSARNWWAETEIIGAEDADKLSLSDESDTQRIPPGGTPGFTVWNLRGGLDLTSNLNLILALENVMDDNYRVHGSGQNEPGRNFVVYLDYTF
jgi:hemoglobin/transferrin/lactoferrin receptor protein